MAYLKNRLTFSSTYFYICDYVSIFWLRDYSQRLVSDMIHIDFLSRT